MKMPLCTILLLFVWVIQPATAQQLPTGKLPERRLPAIPNYTPNYHPNTQSHINPQTHTAIPDVQRRNDALRNEVAQYERYLKEKQRQDDFQKLLSGRFPEYQPENNMVYYYEAYNEIKNMLQGDAILNLGTAVFLVENAYYDNMYHYEDFIDAIKYSTEVCFDIIDRSKLDKNNNLVKNMMIFRYISDTLKWKDKNSQNIMHNYPIQYNYGDYQSKINFDSHFVTKLMQTGKGQCHSMPLYYLILAEEMDADAYLSYSPKHSFVKMQDNGVWYNLELTCKAILSDAHYMNNSYIKAEAIKNRIYLEPMDKRNTVAQMLIELARGYYYKYGYDDFFMQCVETAELYSDNKLNAKIMKAAYQTRITLVLADLLQASNPDIMKEISPQAYTQYEKMMALYDEIDKTGYEDLPEELYARWLDYIAKEKEKKEKESLRFIDFRWE